MSLRITSWAILIGAMIATPASACLWDRDTLAAEAKGMPGVVEVITGRFERNPPLYYEMRLERVTKELGSRPDDLALYDDAGVACDRLGRDDEAIEWMARKKAQLDAVDPNDPLVKDHTYRYLANLGTFHAHRWFRNGKKREEIAELEKARELIAAAIRLNPNAHFGREEVQLNAIEWSLANADEAKHGDLAVESLGFKGATSVGSIEGWMGLIVLGAAWESEEIFGVLVERVGFRQASIGTLAWMRVEELRARKDPGFSGSIVSIWSGEELDLIERYYVAAREAAEQWQEHRTAFMMNKMQAGMHPDTDASFWEGYEPIPPHPYPNWLANKLYVYQDQYPLAAILCSLVALGVAWKIWQRKRARKNKEAAAQP